MNDVASDQVTTQLTVGPLMTPDPITIRDSDSLEHCVRMLEEGVASPADIDTATFRELVSYGLLPKSSEYFDDADLEVARASGALVAAGIDVRHLRPFKSAAERELGLADHVLGHQALRGRAADAEELDDDTVTRRVVEDCLDLHLALIRRGLQTRG